MRTFWEILSATAIGGGSDIVNSTLLKKFKLAQKVVVKNE